MPNRGIGGCHGNEPRLGSALRTVDPASEASRVRPDLLTWAPIRRLLRWAAFPVAFQAVAVAAVACLAANGLGVGSGMAGGELLTLRKTNLTTLVVWGLWCPGMIAVAIAGGRAWYTVCPMELVHRIGDAIARRAGWPSVRLGAFLRGGWMVVVLYLVLQLLVAGVSLHRVPHFTALLLLALLALALASGFVFREGRAFCKALCPASALLSVYGRFTPLQLEARSASACANCATKDCVRAENRDRFDRRSCPSGLVPFRRAPSDGCVLCLQCAKVCPHGNMGFGLVAPDAPIRRRALLRPAEAAFVAITLGFVAHEVAGEFKWLDAGFHAVPAALQGFAPSIAFGWFEAFWFLVLLPAAVWTIVAAAGYAAGHRSGIGSLFLAAATGAAPVVVIAHLAKAIAKVGSWGGFVPLAVADPRGLATLRRLAEGSLPVPPPLASLATVGSAALLALGLLVWLGWRRTGGAAGESVVAARAGLCASVAMFSAILAVWVWPVR